MSNNRLRLFVTAKEDWDWNTSSKSVSSVAQSCLTLCDPMDCSMPGFPVHHQLSELVQTHVHSFGDAKGVLNFVMVNIIIKQMLVSIEYTFMFVFEVDLRGIFPFFLTDNLLNFLPSPRTVPDLRSDSLILLMNEHLGTGEEPWKAFYAR